MFGALHVRTFAEFDVRRQIAPQLAAAIVSLSPVRPTSSSLYTVHPTEGPREDDTFPRVLCGNPSEAVILSVSLHNSRHHIRQTSHHSHHSVARPDLSASALSAQIGEFLPAVVQALAACIHIDHPLRDFAATPAPLGNSHSSGFTHPV